MPASISRVDYLSEHLRPLRKWRGPRGRERGFIARLACRVGVTVAAWLFGVSRRTVETWKYRYET